MSEYYDDIKGLFDQALKEAEEKAKQEFNDDEDMIIERKAWAVTDFYKDLDKFIAYIKLDYKKELRVRRAYYPKKWMLDDDKIFDKLEKYRIIDVLNFVDRNNLEPKGQRAEELGKGLEYETKDKKGKDVKYPYSLILVNKGFYKSAEKALKMKRSTAHKYMQQLKAAGALRTLKKIGREWLYADGYYVEWDGKLTKKRFLKNTPTARKALREFRIVQKGPQ